MIRRTDKQGWSARLEDALRYNGAVDLVGVGNAVRGDDGVGIEIVRRLRSRVTGSHRRLRIHSVSYMPERLLSRLAYASRRVVVFDAVEASEAPGTVVCGMLGDAKYGFFATHNIPLKLIPGLESRLDDFYIVGVQPESLEVREGLSDVVSDAADRVVDFFAARAEARS